MMPRFRRLAIASTLASATLALPLSSLAAQGSKAAAAPAAIPSLVGSWAGTASVPLKDSSLTVPVLYTFTQSGTSIGGNALVPGQGAGPISHVVVDGKKVRFRVTASATPAAAQPGKPAPAPAAPKELEHEGAFTADGAIEGFVNLDKQPVAKFRIMPNRNVAPKK
jgi:hypothetical protein